MKHHVLPGNPPLRVTLRRSRQARRLSLRVSRLDGRVTLTMPVSVQHSVAVAFLEEKENWLRKHTEAHPEAIHVTLGQKVPILGQMHKVEAAPGKRFIREGGRILIPGSEVTVGVRLRGYLRELARVRLGAASDRYAQSLGRSFDRLTLRDTRSRWGSCTSDGGLMFSWRLIMAPPEVLDYVAAHEVAHLEEMNHSPAFWQLVDEIYGDCTAARTWLRTNGHALHRYRFEN